MKKAKAKAKAVKKIRRCDKTKKTKKKVWVKKKKKNLSNREENGRHCKMANMSEKKRVSPEKLVKASHRKPATKDLSEKERNNINNKNPSRGKRNCKNGKQAKRKSPEKGGSETKPKSAGKKKNPGEKKQKNSNNKNPNQSEQNTKKNNPVKLYCCGEPCDDDEEYLGCVWVEVLVLGWSGSTKTVLVLCFHQTTRTQNGCLYASSRSARLEQPQLPMPRFWSTLP